ncbi:MAG: hypothetical protein Q8P05_01720 [Candidatus Diapherotrites archaeon]|nr:hypothetical protein [Candidatus Diapherotrites archaeon]
MPSDKPLKQREEVLKSLLKKIDQDIDSFTRVAEKLHAKHEKLLDTVMDAGLEPIPVKFSAAKTEDALQEVESHILELNKLKNLISMKLKRILQEEDLLDHLQNHFGKEVSFKRTKKGAIELEVKDPEADAAMAMMQVSKKRVDDLRNQIHELGDLNE